VIGQLIEEAGRRAHAADIAVKTDETLTLTFEAGRLTSTSYAEERGANLRVIAGGRLGVAGATGEHAEDLVDRALASARVGEPLELLLPEPASLPRVTTHYPQAASAQLDDLAQLGRLLIDRLSRDGCQVNVVVERSLGSVQLANTLGLEARYDVSAVGLSLEVIRVRNHEVLVVGDYLAGADLPPLTAVEAMVAGVLRRVEWAERTVAPPTGKQPVCFTRGATAALLLPLQLAFLGKSVLQGASPVGDKVGKQAFAAGFTLSDEPLLDGRPGSRPMDDEGVPSARLPLVEGGVVRHFIYDLETAARARVPSTGHGRRSTFAKPQAAYSNLVVAPGDHSFDELIASVDHGLLVDALVGVGQGNVIGGAFSHPVALAYRIENGQISGRVSSTLVAANAYDLLRRILGLGRELEWVGSLAAPPMLVDAVSVVGQ
jgi:PmbA protein